MSAETQGPKRSEAAQRHHDYYVRLAREGQLHPEDLPNLRIAVDREKEGRVKPLEDKSTLWLARKLFFKYFAIGLLDEVSDKFKRLFHRQPAPTPTPYIPSEAYLEELRRLGQDTSQAPPTNPPEID